MISLTDDALSYRAIGMSVLPLKSDKKPAVRGRGSLDIFKVRLSTDSEIRDLFNKPSVKGIGVMLGDVSGGLACRDFDQPGGYDQWRRRFPRLAELTPTVKTGREGGHHVYFRGDVAAMQAATGNDCQVNIGDGEGELKFSNVYTVLPPSLHPSGAIYELVEGDFDFLPDIDPFRFGLAPKKLLEKKPLRQDGLSGPGWTCVNPHTAAPKKEFLDPKNPIIQHIFRLTLPTQPGVREIKTFPLAQYLLGIRELGGATFRDLLPIIREWHGLASLVATTLECDITLDDFYRSWKNVKHPKRKIFYGLLDLAENSDPPACAEGFDPTTVKLLTFCRELQCYSGDQPFPLSARLAGESMGVSRTLASRRLNMLCSLGLLHLEHEAVGRRLSREWFYMGGD